MAYRDVGLPSRLWGVSWVSVTSGGKVCSLLGEGVRAELSMMLRGPGDTLPHAHILKPLSCGMLPRVKAVLGRWKM